MSPRKNVPVVSTTAPARSSRPSASRTPVTQPFDHQVIDLAFDDGQIHRRPDRGLHRRRIELAIGLGARPAHRRAFAPIEDPELDAASVGHAAHQPIQGVNLADEMPLPQPANRRIARHGADGGEAMRHQCGSRAHARGCGRSLTAGMATANHNHIEVGMHRKHHLTARAAALSKLPPHIDPIKSVLHRAMRLAKAYEAPALRSVTGQCGAEMDGCFT